MKQWQWNSHLINSEFVRKPMDNFLISLPLFNFFQTQPLVSQHCTPRMQLVLLHDAHSKSGNPQCQHTFNIGTQHMDINYTIFCSNYSHHTHLPRRNIKIYYNKEANSHLVTTSSLQCCITQLPSTPTL